jgi:hypothetical protein
MILSHRHRFVFVKGSKVGGTSVEIALTGICGPDDIVTPVTPIDDKLRIDRGHVPRNYALDPADEAEYVRRIRAANADAELHDAEIPTSRMRFFNHMPLAEAERRADFSLDGWTIVCVERSPYEKAISLANWMLHADEYHRGRSIRFDLAQTRAALDMLIRDRAILRCRNIDRYRRADGRLEVKTMRFDSLADDFAAWMKALGVPPPVPTLPHVKSGNYRARPIDVLSMSQIAAINELFRDEFAYFRHPLL